MPGLRSSQPRSSTCQLRSTPAQVLPHSVATNASWPTKTPVTPFLMTFHKRLELLCTAMINHSNYPVTLLVMLARMVAILKSSPDLLPVQVISSTKVKANSTCIALSRDQKVQPSQREWEIFTSSGRSASTDVVLLEHMGVWGGEPLESDKVRISFQRSCLTRTPGSCPSYHDLRRTCQLMILTSVAFISATRRHATHAEKWAHSAD